MIIINLSKNKLVLLMKKTANQNAELIEVVDFPLAEDAIRLLRMKTELIVIYIHQMVIL